VGSAPPSCSRRCSSSPAEHNPNLVRAQIEGRHRLRVDHRAEEPDHIHERATDQANFTDYPLLSMEEMPRIVSVIVDSSRPPQGVGEVVLAPVAPAMAGAILNASGARIDAMPFPNDLFAR
jgi:isoquinoline 1-oxidoreductase subunit beta